MVIVKPVASFLHSESNKKHILYSRKSPFEDPTFMLCI